VILKWILKFVLQFVDRIAGTDTAESVVLWGRRREFDCLKMEGEFYWLRKCCDLKWDWDGAVNCSVTGTQ
jgi:hypothetical protein